VQPEPPSMKQYSRAEERLKESLWIRCNGLPQHDYPGRLEDLATVRAFHRHHGIPPSGRLRRLLWWLRGAA
jgi:hypothetical protein